MYYIGIDPSLTGSGLVIIDEEKIVKQLTVSTSPKDPMEVRINTIGDMIVNLSILNDLDKLYSIGGIAIEGLSFGSKGQSILELGGLHYHLRMLLWNNNIGYTIVPPTTLKKFVTGKGTCKKDLMLLKVYKRWNEEFSDDNLADAFSLAMFMKEKYPGGTKVIPILSKGIDESVNDLRTDNPNL